MTKDKHGKEKIRKKDVRKPNNLKKIINKIKVITNNLYGEITKATN